MIALSSSKLQTVLSFNKENTMTIVIETNDVKVFSVPTGHKAVSTIDNIAFELMLDHNYKPLTMTTKPIGKVVTSEQNGVACERFSELLKQADAYNYDNVVALQMLCD